MQRNHLIHPRKFLSAHFFAVTLSCLGFSLAAFGAGDISRSYNYKGYDSGGNLVVKGIITLVVNESVEVRGDWEFKILDRAKLKEFGPQDGSGKVVSQMKGDRMFVNLSPPEYQNSIYLDGRVTKANVFRIAGKWGYYGFVGKLNEGKFEMTRRKPSR